MTKIIVDSTCDFSLEEAEKAGLTMLSLHVRFGDEEFLDKRTITNEEFYKKLIVSKELPSTALVSAGEFLEAYENIPDDDIIVITLSSKLSGTYQAAMVAREISGRDNIFVVDSGSASLGTALIVDKALELKDSLSAKELYGTLKKYVARLRIVGVVDTLKYLVKGGRLSAISGTVGGLLGIKPMLLIKNGDIINIGKPRGIDNAVKQLDEMLRFRMKIDRREEIIFAHADNETGLEKLIKTVGRPKNSRIMSIGSVVGTHTGPGVICAAFFEHPLVGNRISNN